MDDGDDAAVVFIPAFVFSLSFVGSFVTNEWKCLGTMFDNDDQPLVSMVTHIEDERFKLLTYYYGAIEPIATCACVFLLALYMLSSCWIFVKTCEMDSLVCKFSQVINLKIT